MNNSTLIFVDEKYWTEDFDQNLVLEGEYEYSNNGNELNISAIKNGVGLYKY